jgi:hypothetical protein
MAFTTRWVAAGHRRMAGGCILRTPWALWKSHVRNECLGKGTVLTKNSFLSTFMLFMVMGAVLTVVVGHFAGISIPDFAVHSLRVSVARSVPKRVGK